MKWFELGALASGLEALFDQNLLRFSSLNFISANICDFIQIRILQEAWIWIRILQKAWIWIQILQKAWIWIYILQTAWIWIRILQEAWIWNRILQKKTGSELDPDCPESLDLDPNP